VGDCPGFWREWAIEEKRKNPKVKAHEVWWRMYGEIVRRGADALYTCPGKFIKMLDDY
jgi:hypothetical protein